MTFIFDNFKFQVVNGTHASSTSTAAAYRTYHPPPPKLVDLYLPLYGGYLSARLIYHLMYSDPHYEYESMTLHYAYNFAISEYDSPEAASSEKNHTTWINKWNIRPSYINDEEEYGITMKLAQHKFFVIVQHPIENHQQFIERLDVISKNNKRFKSMEEDDEEISEYDLPIYYAVVFYVSRKQDIYPISEKFLTKIASDPFCVGHFDCASTFATQQSIANTLYLIFIIWKQKMEEQADQFKSTVSKKCNIL